MPRKAVPGDWLALLALTALWGTAFAFIEIALTAWTPVALVTGRLVSAAVVLLVYLRVRGESLPTTPAAWLPLIVMAVLGSLLPFHLIAWAQQSISSSMAAVLMSVMPLYVLTLAHFFVPGSRLNAAKIVGFVAGFAGVVLVIGPEAIGAPDGSTAVLAAFAVLGASLSYAVNSIYARRLGAVDPVRTSAGLFLVASAASLPMALSGELTIAPPDFATTSAMLILGLLSTGLATLFYFRIIQGPGPEFLSMVNYLVPGWAVAVGAIFLNETISPAAYAGFALILGGIGISEFGPGLVRRVGGRVRDVGLQRSVVRAAEDAG